jgi:hypothetical protein
VRGALGFGDADHPGLVGAASTAVTADVDILLTLDPAALERADVFKV